MDILAFGCFLLIMVMSITERIISTKEFVAWVRKDPSHSIGSDLFVAEHKSFVVSSYAYAAVIGFSGFLAFIVLSRMCSNDLKIVVFGITLFSNFQIDPEIKKWTRSRLGKSERELIDMWTPKEPK